MTGVLPGSALGEEVEVVAKATRRPEPVNVNETLSVRVY